MSKRLHIDNGAYDSPDYEWGTASSPIIYEDKVIVQVDTQGEDYLLAVDAASGKTAWKAARDEMPSWGTPTIYPGKDRVELVTNAPNFIRGNDPKTGKRQRVPETVLVHRRSLRTDRLQLELQHLLEPRRAFSEAGKSTSR